MSEISIGDLDDYPMSELRLLWLKYFGAEPTSNSKEFYVSRLAHRFQELEFGGLKAEVVNMLIRMYKEKNFTKPKFIHDYRLPPIGSSIIKIYDGKEHRVTLLKQGFDYDGKKYKSLSGVARAITGQHMSGYCFFGLQDRRK